MERSGDGNEAAWHWYAELRLRHVDESDETGGVSCVSRPMDDLVTIALMGASAGAALAMGDSRGWIGAKAGVKQLWVGNWSLKTGNPTTFIGTGLFTAAGGSRAKRRQVDFPKGSFVVNMSKTTFGYTPNPHICLATSPSAERSDCKPVRVPVQASPGN